MSFQDKLKPVQQPTPATGGFQQKLKPLSTAPKSTFDVPEPANYRENRIKQFQSEQVGYDAAAKEANSFWGKTKNFSKGLVKAIAPSEVGLGKTIAGILYQGGKEDKALQETVMMGEDIKYNLAKTIREQEAQGKDTTRLKQAYNEQEKNVANTARTARDLVQLPTNAQAVGQVVGTGLDVLTAGTYSKAKTGVMATGQLFRGGTPAVKTLATAVGVPELGVVAGQKASGLFSARGLGNIATGATTGYASDVALGLQGERGTEREGASAFIPGLGTVLGTAIPVASEATQTLRNIANPQPRIVEKRLGALRDLETKNGKIARVFDAADRRGIDVRKTLSETNLLNGAVDADGRISSDKALNNFNEFIAPYEGKVKEALVTEGRSIQLNQLADEAKSFIDNSTLSDRQKVELQKEIADNLEAFQQFRGRAVPVAAVHDTKVVLANANNYLNPGKNIVDKEAARFFKEVVEKNTSSMDVKAYNGELSKYYTVREALEAMDRAVVSGGRMGKYFSSLIGSGVGGLAGGPIGAIAGAEAGAMARGSQLSRAFGGDVKTGLKATPELTSSLMPTATGKAAIPDVVIGRKKPVVPDVSVGPSRSVPRAATGDLSVVPAKAPAAPAKKAPPVPKWAYEPIPDASAKDFFANKSFMESLKDQGGFAKNPLGKGETTLQRVARIRESSAKINRLNPKALDIIEQFVDFQAGKFDTVGEPKVLRENIDVIAKELGFTEQGPKLADRFREVLDARMDKTTRGAKMLPVGKAEGATPATTAPKYNTVGLKDKYTDLAEAMFRTPDEVKVYRGSGKGIGNSTFVKGQYWADSSKFAETFGDVNEGSIPKNTAIFDFDIVKNNPNQKLIPKELLVDQKALTDYLINRGIEYTKNTNSRGVEYVKLNKVLNEMQKKAISMPKDKFKQFITANYDKYKDEIARVRESYTMADNSRLRSAVDDIWEEANR